MNTVDLILVLLIIVVAYRGVASGFLRQLGALGGFAVGLMVGALLAPLVTAILPAGTWRGLLVLLVFFGTAFALAGLGETVGYGLSGLAAKYRMRPLDAALGATFGVVVVLVSVWLLTATFARTLGPGIAAEIQSSRVLRLLDQSLPPAPEVMSGLERALGTGRFPRVFTGLEPTPAPPVTGPNAAAVNAAAAAGSPSTVRIEGLGCGGLLEGSGFVVGKNLVATNAHVVAGIDRPYVVDSAGSHAASVVVFDPNLDFAVLRTTRLAAAPLSVSQANVPRGTVGAALGYPGGGDLTVSPAAVLGRQTAIGRSIYDTGLVRRDIYSLQAQVRPGNSGGPLVTPDGTVVGVIFATSTINGNVGYALTSAEIIPDLERARANPAPVSTGACVAD